MELISVCTMLLLSRVADARRGAAGKAVGLAVLLVSSWQVKSHLDDCTASSSLSGSAVAGTTPNPRVHTDLGTEQDPGVPPRYSSSVVWFLGRLEAGTSAVICGPTLEGCEISNYHEKRVDKRVIRSPN